MSAVIEHQSKTKEIKVEKKLIDLLTNTRLFSVEEYHKMIETGIINEDDRVELLDGRIIEMSPKSAAHAAVNEDVADIFKNRLKKKAVVRSQNPIILDDRSEPEPDIVIATPPKHKYYSQHPTPSDILLVMEISDATLSRDRQTKGAAYAECGIIQYLLLNLKKREIEDYREPSKDGYRSKQTYTAKQSFSLVAFPNVLIKVRDLLPPE